MSSAWRDRRGELVSNVTALREALARSTRFTPDVDVPGESLIPAAVESIVGTFDPEWGGFGAAPKFPSTMALDLILSEVVHLGVTDERTPLYLAAVSTSLDAMASGGIYDHLGGGFARYSVDERWLVPHFEKMLYDQALFVRLYAHAAAATNSPGGARSSPRPSSTWSAIYGSREVDSPRPRMPTPPDRTATTTRDCSTRGRRPRSPRRSAPSRPPCVSSTTSPRPETSSSVRSPTASAIGHTTGSGRRRSKPPARRCSPPAKSVPGRASTTRCSRSGTP